MVHLLLLAVYKEHALDRQISWQLFANMVWWTATWPHCEAGLQWAHGWEISENIDRSDKHVPLFNHLNSVGAHLEVSLKTCKVLWGHCKHYARDKQDWIRLITNQLDKGFQLTKPTWLLTGINAELKAVSEA